MSVFLSDFMNKMNKSEHHFNEPTRLHVGTSVPVHVAPYPAGMIVTHPVHKKSFKREIVNKRALVTWCKREMCVGAGSAALQHCL